MPNCPACGDYLPGITPLVRSLGCPSCGHWVLLSHGQWSAGGRFDQQLDAPGFLQLGVELTLDYRQFTVSGRVRLGHDDGLWDEWWLTDDAGGGLWLEEDDGQYRQHAPMELDSSVIKTDPPVVGQMFEAGGVNWLVTESFIARLLGAEGFLPTAFDSTAGITCVDATGGGRQLSIEYWPDGLSASTAEVVSGKALALA